MWDYGHPVVLKDAVPRSEGQRDSGHGKGQIPAPASASERQLLRVFEVRTLTNASQRWWALSPWYNAEEVS
jgi:hypothetical protein